MQELVGVTLSIQDSNLLVRKCRVRARTGSVALQAKDLDVQLPVRGAC